MSLVLDPQTEQRIQKVAAEGAYADPADLINRALDLLEANRSWSESWPDSRPGSWSDEEKADLDRRYDEGMAACDRGEGLPGDKVREMLAQRRANRVA